MILHVIRGSRLRVRFFSLNTGATGTRIHGDIALVVPRFLTQEVDQSQVVERRLGYRIQGLLVLKHTAGERGIEVGSTDSVEGRLSRMSTSVPSESVMLTTSMSG